jgi:hypothetical protein
VRADQPGIQAGLCCDRWRFAVTPLFGLAGDATGIQEAALDAERLTDGQLGAFGDPPPENGSVFGDQPGFAIVLLAVEVGLGLAVLRAELLAQVRDDSCASQVGQTARRPNDQGSALDRRGDHDCGARWLLRRGE